MTGECDDQGTISDLRLCRCGKRRLKQNHKKKNRNKCFVGMIMRCWELNLTRHLTENGLK